MNVNGVVFQFYFDFFKSMFSSHIKNSIKKKKWSVVMFTSKAYENCSNLPS